MKCRKFSSLYLIIIIILLHSFFVICADECKDCEIDSDTHKCKTKTTCEDGVTCVCNEQKCRPHLYSGICYYCEGLTPSKYYSISEGSCTVKTQATECNKITYENNECVDDCGDGFELGDYCFKTCDSTTTQDETLKTCKCNIGNKNYYTEIDINGKKFHKCLSSCPYFHEESTGKCVDKCTGDTSRITQNNGCKEKCGDNEYLYKIKVGSETQYYCLDVCPDIANFYYEKQFPEEETICREKCDGHDFYIKTPISPTSTASGYKCSKTCATAYIDSKNNIFECKGETTITSCSDSFPYEYKGSCFRNCSDTKSMDYFDNIQTYIYDYHGLKKCSETCVESYTTTENGNSETDTKYIDQYNLTCVDCKETAFKFYFGNHCLETCATSNNIHPNYVDETGECVFQCPEDYLKLGNVCYKQCPQDSDKKFKDRVYDECNTCNIPKDPNNLQYGEGYFIKVLKDYYPESLGENPRPYYWPYNDNIICLSSCPLDSPFDPESQLTENEKYRFHKNDDNECMFGTGCEDIEGNTYKYSKADATTADVIVCYKSCKDIPGNYLYEKEYKCYENELAVGVYSFCYIEQGIKKYFGGEEQAKFEKCSKLGLMYTRGKECIKECDSEEYKIPYKTENGVITKLGECIIKNGDTPSENCPYYNSIDNICYTNCEYKIVKDNTGAEKVSAAGNCVRKCSLANPYEYEDESGENCIDECPNFYIETAGEKKCVSDCKSLSKFHFPNDKKCVDKCEKQINGKSIYYYYNDNNKCLETCTINTEPESKTFAFKAENSPQPCISGCPDGYKYHYDDNICLDKCTDGYIKKKGEYDCVLKCDKTPDKQEYIINGNTCSNQCPKEEPFIVQITIGGETFDKCVPNCENENSNLKFYRENKEIGEDDKYMIYDCLITCNSNEKVYGKKCMGWLDQAGETVNPCPNGLYDELNICLPKCENKPYFKKDEEKGFYECVDSCAPLYISSNNECVSSCPLGEQFFGIDKKCKNKCDPLIDGQYYKKIGTESPYSFECLKECPQGTGTNPSYSIIDGTNECFVDTRDPTKKCPDNAPYYDPDNNKCYSLCIKSPNNPFTNKVSKECVSGCPTTGETYYQEDKVCVTGCEGKNKIINEGDNSCVNKCDINSQYKYLKNTDPKKCINSCSKYTIDNYICYDGGKCPKPFNYLIGNECHEKCLETQFANPTEENEPILEYKCKDACGQEITGSEYLYYYENERICLKECKGNDFNIQNTKKCVQKCDSPYHFYIPKDDNSQIKKNTCVLTCPDDKPYLDIDNYCKVQCEKDGFKYYDPSDKICKNNCDNYKKNGFECIPNCLTVNKFTDETNTCKDSCSTSTAGYIYYYKSDKKCLRKCNDGDFIYEQNDQKECVTSCYDDKKYIYNQNCVYICPSNQKYFIAEFHHSEVDINQYCLTDCPFDYPFLHIEQGDEGKTYYKCLDTCNDYYKTNNDPYINAKECTSTCTFFVYNNETHKECFDVCPTEKQYYINSESETPKECLKACPSTHPYHNKNSFECLKSCDTKYAKKKENGKECVSKCDINSYWIKEKAQDDEDMILCIDDCDEIEHARFITPEKECVNNCDETNFFTGNNNKGTCDCMGLYYYTDEGKLICLNNNIKKCGEEDERDSDSKNYKIQINGSNQCIKNCFRLLSPSEDICYMDGTCPPDTEKGIYEGKIKCECKYKYYIDSNGKKNCLSEGVGCPTDYKYIDPDKNQCLLDCNGYDIIFDNKCLTNCPYPLTIADDGQGGKTCECANNWYKESDNKYVCLSAQEICTNNYPYLISDTKECVKTCKGTDYNILYNNECKSSCGNDMEKLALHDSTISDYTCVCKYIWAENSGCSADNADKKCSYFNVNLKFLIKTINKCVKNCPKEYKYFFNNECFSSCDEAKEYYNVKDNDNSDSTECQCQSYWRIKQDDETRIECRDQCDENEIEVDEKKQCITIPNEDDLFKCPYNYPYLFNKICYSKCPNNTEIDETKGNECKCKFLWLENENGNIICLQEGKKCPVTTHKYLIDEKKQCVTYASKCPENYKKFNYTCYKECPPGTTLDEGNEDEENDCICDQNNFWYRYKKSEDYREYYECDVKNCNITGDKLYYYNETKECINKCSDLGEKKYEYGKVCYDKCPDFTKEDEKKLICEFSTEAEDLQELVGNVSEKIVDLYPNLPEGGLVISNEKASMQIYGINKVDKAKKNSIMRTNLAYIDLSGCIDKIYRSNDMKDRDDIVVVKLDLKSQKKKLVINPIEYQFINSNNGKILDASVCEKNEIVISYPITYMLNKKLRMLQGNEELTEEEKKEILEKFNRGKLLNEKNNSIDTFNFNSSIYSDICLPIEIDGKDLVLEDRIEFLYPNYSFCESICTYDYTDFQGERIYCNCSIKSEVQVDRPHEVKIILFNKKEMDNNQKGPTNLPILKCISKAQISGNGAFIFCIVFIAVEIGLLLFIIFQGINSLINKMNRKINKNNDKEEENVIDADINNYKNSENENIRNNNNEKICKYETNSDDNNIINSNNDNDSGTKRKMKSEGKKVKANPPKNGDGTIDDDEDVKNEINVISIKKNKNDVKQKNFNEKNNFDTISNEIDNNNNEYTENNEDNNNNQINKYLQKNGIETGMGLLQSMKREVQLLRTKYQYSLLNDKFDAIIVVLTSIFDKIYLIKILLLPDKYQIMSVMFSLYLLCHMLLLTFITFFYYIQTIKEIRTNENYPTTNYYLGYGFLANLIVWIIFRLFYCLLDNQHKIKKLNTIQNIDKEKFNQKFNNSVSKIKRNIIVYLVIQFVLIMFCSFYLITFCGIYIGTKKNIFQSYGIAFVEIIIIKIIYGLILGILRKVSLYKNIKMMYDIILCLNKYIS